MGPIFNEQTRFKDVGLFFSEVNTSHSDIFYFSKETDLWRSPTVFCGMERVLIYVK